jgi:hypothetical protein
MASDLRAALPLLMPKAIAWAESQFSFIAEAGQPIDSSLFAVAQSVGVLHPELIRIAEVSHLPLPEDPELRRVALGAGLLGQGMVGLTFGYGVYICHGHKDLRLLSHEFRHVYQYEHTGSIASFLPIYLEQIATFGYDDAPFEVDARAHERCHA